MQDSANNDGSLEADRWNMGAERQTSHDGPSWLSLQPWSQVG